MDRIISSDTLDAKITAQLAKWVTLNYTSKWTREDYDRPTYMTGLFFHNIARRWPTCPVYDDNGHLTEGMELTRWKKVVYRHSKKNYYTQQMGLRFEPIKDWTINIDGNMRTHQTISTGQCCQFMHTMLITNLMP